MSLFASDAESASKAKATDRRVNSQLFYLVPALKVAGTLVSRRSRLRLAPPSRWQTRAGGSGGEPPWPRSNIRGLNA